MKINWNTRLKHPMFYISVASTVMSVVLAYNGMVAEDVTSWMTLGDVLLKCIKNPFLVWSVVCAVLSYLGVRTDMTTSGLKDSAQALEYDEPKKDEVG